MFVYFFVVVGVENVFGMVVVWVVIDGYVFDYVDDGNFYFFEYF